MLDDINTPVKSLPFMLPEESHKVLSDFNNFEHVKDSSWIYRLFEDQVDKTPNAVALSYEQQDASCESQKVHEITFREFDIRANQIANYLLNRGVKPGSSIAILMTRSHIQVITQLAVLKLGCTYIPITSAFSAKRQKFIVEDSGATCVIATHQKDLDLLNLERDSVVTMVTYEEEQETIELQSLSRPKLDLPKSSKNYPAYIM